MSRILANQVVSYGTPGEAWRHATSLIEVYGSKVITEDRKISKEVQNLTVTVRNPLEGWPIPGSSWDLPGLDAYASQLLLDDNPSGFAYTYGERLWSYLVCLADFDIDDVNQIESIIARLQTCLETRRAIAITWVPGIDGAVTSKEVPCLQFIEFLYRDNQLNMTATFRSHDILRAWPANVYGLSKLLEYVARKVGVPTGYLTTFSVSAHIEEV